jgi:CTP synthase
VATQAHPELKSRPDHPHPLFAAFVGAALRRRKEEETPMFRDDRSVVAEAAR